MPDIKELDDAALQDLLSDARHSEEQAKHGPYYPDRGITAESLRAYAAKCRAQADLLKNGDRTASYLTSGANEHENLGKNKRVL